MSSFHLMTVKRLRTLLNQNYQEHGDAYDECYITAFLKPIDDENDERIALSTHFHFVEWKDGEDSHAELQLFPVRPEALDEDFVPPPTDDDAPEENDDET